MRQAAVRYGGVEEHFAARMTRAQAMRLRTLSDEAYQPRLFEEDLTRAEADRRIEVLKAEIELANSF
jgi:Protein of unknown function (DUF3072)